MNTRPFSSSTSRVLTDKPMQIGGTEGRRDATARGGVITVREACKGARWGSLRHVCNSGVRKRGQRAALLHQELLGVASSLRCAIPRGIYDGNGFNSKELVTHKLKTGSVVGFPGSKPIPRDSCSSSMCRYCTRPLWRIRSTKRTLRPSRPPSFASWQTARRRPTRTSFFTKKGSTSSRISLPVRGVSRCRISRWFRTSTFWDESMCSPAAGRQDLEGIQHRPGSHQREESSSSPRSMVGWRALLRHANSVDGYNGVGALILFCPRPVTVSAARAASADRVFILLISTLPFRRYFTPRNSS